MKLVDTSYGGVSITVFSTAFPCPGIFLSFPDTQAIPLDFYVSRNRDGLRSIIEYQ